MKYAINHVHIQIQFLPFLARKGASEMVEEGFLAPC